jgi:hypothetical protein
MIRALRHTSSRGVLRPDLCGGSVRSRAAHRRAGAVRSRGITPRHDPRSARRDPSPEVGR